MSHIPAQLAFLSPPPGLEPLVDFTLAQLHGTPGLFSLTSPTGNARLFVLDAATHLPHYTPRLPASELERIGTGAATVLVVVNPSAQSTVNLAAPILLNEKTGACIQVILEDPQWSLRAPLLIP